MSVFVLGHAQDFLSKNYGLTWTAGGGSSLLTAPPNAGSLTPIDINDNGDMVGKYSAPLGVRPFAILDGVFYDLMPCFAGVRNLEV